MPVSQTMTVPQITFHFNVSDGVAYALQLITTLYQAHRTLAVSCANYLLADHIDQGLWINQQDFIPHVRYGSPIADKTPIVIDVFPEVTIRPYCINLSPHIFLPCPYEYVIEIVTQCPDNRQAARERYRRWREAGCVINTVDRCAKTV